MQPSDTPSPQLEVLLSAMKREARKARALRKLRMGVAVSFVCVLLCFLVWEHVFGGGKNSSWISIVQSLVNLCVIGIAAYINSESRKSLVQLLANTEDIRVCGAIIDVLGFEDPELKKIARETLKTLVPRLQATDAPLLTTERHRLLHGLLKQSDTELTIIVLKALQQVGDRRDWNAVQHLANGKTKGKEKANPEVIAAAQECLPFLQANAARQEGQQTLLRASDAVSASPGILLRPAQSEIEEPAQLLRAGSMDNV